MRDAHDDTAHSSGARPDSSPGDAATSSADANEPDTNEPDAPDANRPDGHRRDATEADAHADAPDAAETGGFDAALCVTDAGGWDANTDADADLPMVYVSLFGCDGPGCGTKTNPCRTIQRGIDRAGVVRASSVDVGFGTYLGSVTVPAGLSVYGGFTAAWTPTDGGAAPTIIEGTQGPAVTVSGVVGAPALSTLTIWSKQTASPGESLYGVFISGTPDGGTLTLDNLEVAVGNAGSGGAGAAPASASPPSSSCGAGSGSNGADASAGGTQAGAFSASGYAPGDGLQGGNAAQGQNGTNGQSQCTNDDCVYACSSWLCGVDKGNTDCSSAGSPGCGGGGGQGGGGGGGGGSSIGVYIWDALVQLSGGSVSAGNGGNGGPGTGGSQGAAGSAGSPGSTVSCVTSTSDCLGSCADSYESATGTAGGGGGTGGTGGTGGGGAGGSSYALFYESATAPLVLSTDLSCGTAGNGAGGAPDGFAAKQGSPP
jgi:hypothetical protein